LEYCQNDYYWGYGAEMRGMDYTVPDGYAMKRIGSTGHCGLNMHFIRVEDLKLDWKGFNNPDGNWGAAVKNCAECGWAPGRAIECENLLMVHLLAASQSLVAHTMATSQAQSPTGCSMMFRTPRTCPP